MRAILPFIVVGLVTGSLYGLAGTGLVLTYRTSGIFNFAHGAVAAAGAYAFYDMHDLSGWPWPAAALAVVLLFGPVAGVLLAGLSGLVGKGSVVNTVVATVGLLLLIEGILQVHFGPAARYFPEFLPRSAVTLDGVSITAAEFITFGISLAATVLLYLFLRYSRLGIAMRAVVDSPEVATLTGSNPARIRCTAWVIGCSFAALTGVLIAPTLNLDATLLTFLVIQAFGAVAVGAFTNLLGTFVGGLGVGVVASLVTRALASRPNLSGLSTAVPFLVLMVVLMALPIRRLPAARGRVSAPKRVESSRSRWGRPLTAVVLLGLSMMVPFLFPSRLPEYQNALAFVILFLSLGILVSLSGQISLCHAAFAALGATTFAHLLSAGVPWLVALALSGLVLVPVGALVGIPAIRLSGIYLALATFGFGLFMEDFLFNTFLMFGSVPYVSARRPSIFGLNGADDRTFYFMLLSLVVLMAGAVALVNRSRLGRIMRGMAQSPKALVVNGLSLNVSKIYIFCLSAFLAGIAGALFVSQAGEVSGGVGFTPLQSITWVAVLAICGPDLITAAVIASGLLVLLPAYAPSLSLQWQTMLFGVAALVGSVVSANSRELESGFRRLSIVSEDRWLRSPLSSRAMQERKPAAVASPGEVRT